MLRNKKLFLIVTLTVIFLSMTTISAIDTNQSDDNIITNNDDVPTQEIQPIMDTSADDKIKNKENIYENNELSEVKKSSNDSLSTYTYENGNRNTNQYNLPIIHLNADFFNNHNNQLTFVNKRIQLWGDFINMGNIKITANTGEVFYMGSNPMVNTTFTVTGSNFHLGNFKINNSGSDYEENAILIYNTSDALVYNANITYNKSSGEVHGINIYNSINVSVENSVFNVTGVPQNMGWTENYPWQGGVKVTGISYINSSDSFVDENIIYVQNNTDPFVSYYTTMEGITVKDYSHRITLRNNQINVTGGRNNYGTTVSDGSSNITYDNNKFNITGQRYVCGLQYDNSKNCSAINNDIYLLSEVDDNVPLSSNEETISYGIILTAWSNGGTINSTINNNTINATSHVGYGVEIYDATYSDISENTIILDGDKEIGIASYHGHNTNITDNTIHLSGTDADTNNIVEMITPDNQGIIISSASTNNINANTICVHNTGSTTDIYAIKSTSTLNELKNNNVCVCNSLGQKTLSDSISATATTSSGNQLYTCSQCSGSCSPQTTNSLSNYKNKKSIKEDSQTIIITADTFSNYVTNGVLNDNINDGDTLDFQGIFYGDRFSLNINKAVNIISSTNDAYICLDTANIDFFGINVGNSFSVTHNGSGTNISGIFFNNTQLFIKNAENVTLNNITVNNEDLQLGSGVGVTSIRENSSNIKVLNSHFRTKDNLGHSTLVCAWANNVLIENCTIETEGEVGNMFYATTYNLEIDDIDLQSFVNRNITFRNNHINGMKANVGPICYAIALEGCGHVIENNTVEYTGTCITLQWGYGNVSNLTMKNNNIPYGKCQIRFNDSLVIGNNMNNSLLENATVINNNIVSAQIYDNLNLTGNIIQEINSLVSVKNISITNNFIDTLNIVSNSKNLYVANNTIYSSSDYAVNIQKNTENITLENNYIASKNKNATEAINNQTTYTSINNIGIAIYNLTDDDILPYSYSTEEGKLYYEESRWGNNYYFDGVNNSVAYFNINKEGAFNFINQPSIIIMNASNINYLAPQPPFNYGISSFERTSLLINSYLPNTTSYVMDNTDWYTCNVEILFNIVNSTFKESSSVGTQNEIKFFNVSFIDDVKNDTTNIINTSVTVDVEKIIQPNTKSTLKFMVNTENTTVPNGKIVLFDKNTLYGEFDVVDGVVNFTTSFNESKKYSFIAYYQGEGNYNNSNVKFNFTVKNIETYMTIEPVNINLGNITTFTVTITNELGENITGGKVTFKINGKALKDPETGKIIYAHVNNGTATINYMIPDEWAGKTLNITATYLGTTKYASKKANITTEVPETTPTITITSPTESVTSGSNITLKAKVTIDDTPLTTGKIIFKINGKTVKDANGKVVYATVDEHGEVTIPNYNIGNLKAKDYTITATFISSTYDKIEANTTLTVVNA